MNFPENQNFKDPNQVEPQRYGPSIGDEVATASLAPGRTVRRGLSISGWLSWIVILLISGGIFGMTARYQLTQEEQVGGDATPIDMMQIQIQAKAHVGQHELDAKNAPAPPVILDTGPYEQRICFSVLLNETESSTQALAHLKETDKKVLDEELELTPDQERLRSVAEELFTNYDSGNSDSSAIPVEDRDFIKKKLGYVGRLALYPSDSPHTVERAAIVSEAKTLMIGGVVFVILGGLAGLAGFVLSLVFAVMCFTGKLKSKFQNHPTNHNIYAETFAIWMAFFFFSSLGLQFLKIQDDTLVMLLNVGVFFGSLGSLVWPIARGVSFSQFRKDIGWTFGNPFKEVAAGAWVYISTIPFLLPGMIMIVIIMAIMAAGSEPSEFARQSGPGHPIQEDIMSGNVVMIGLVFLATCVAAPIVEETMFRGVLYRHLRDVTAGWAFLVSVVFAALLNSLIFAAIHPQGIFGIPVLATLAIGFTIARQWRDSLFSSMTMHAIHNFLITCVSLLVL